jgi:hypothetical protein
MKSTETQLISRGFLSEDDYNQLIGRNNSLDKLIGSHIPSERTLAIRIIKQDKDKSHIPLLVEILQKEKKLYTKIELCECLVEFGTLSIPFLIPYLGKIGTNQHKTVALVDVNKKTFPLPRDIVARIIIRIGSPALPHLRNVLITKNRTALLEVIDAIGHIAFTTNDYSLENDLLQLYSSKQNDDLIKWKLIRCFQSFESNKIIDLLSEIVELDENGDILKREAERSLARIRTRRKSMEKNKRA